MTHTFDSIHFLIMSSPNNSGVDVDGNYCRRSDDGIGGLGTQCGEIPGSFVFQQRYDQVTGIRLSSERDQRPRRPLPMLQARRKRFKVFDGDVPDWINLVRCVRGYGESEMHVFWGIIL